MEERIGGLTLRDCARIHSKHTELQAQFGKRQLPLHMAAYLAESGFDESSYAQSWSGWSTRMECDPTGRLYGQFATLQQECVVAASMGDAPDASQHTRAGVSLDRYAKISAGIGGGLDPDVLLAADGLDLPQWRRAQEAWNAALATDLTLATQYGMLYASHDPGPPQGVPLFVLVRSLPVVGSLLRALAVLGKAR